MTEWKAYDMLFCCQKVMTEGQNDKNGVSEQELQKKLTEKGYRILIPSASLEEALAAAEGIHIDRYVANQLQRGMFALEDGEWDRARAFFDRILNLDAKCLKAYLGKLMADMGVTDLEKLKNRRRFGIYWKNENCIRILQSGDEKSDSDIRKILENMKEDFYEAALEKMGMEEYEEAIQILEMIKEYRDAWSRIETCRQLEKEIPVRVDCLALDLRMEEEKRKINACETVIIKNRKEATKLKDWLQSVTMAEAELRIAEERMAVLEQEKQKLLLKSGLFAVLAGGRRKKTEAEIWQLSREINRNRARLAPSHISANMRQMLEKLEGTIVLNTDYRTAAKRRLETLEAEKLQKWPAVNGECYGLAYERAVGEQKSKRFLEILHEKYPEEYELYVSIRGKK